MFFVLFFFSVAIIVPFRDEHKEQHRSSHLAQFMSYMLGYMSRSLVPFHIYIIEQSHNDGRKFNRGKLLNIGYNIAKKGKERKRERTEIFEKTVLKRTFLGVTNVS